MSHNSEWKQATKAIHAGSEPEEQHQAINLPLYLNSTFTFTDLKQADDTFSFKRRAYVYTRGGNPTINLFERRMAALEGGEAAVAFASGMAAITTVLLSLLIKDQHIVAHRNLYGSTYAAISEVFPRFGIDASFIDMTDLAAVEQAITPNTKVFYFETPTNPSLEIIDIAAIAKLAHARGIKVVVDNTFATPILQQPLLLGADVVVHSASKYICGHGDAIGGVAIANQEYMHGLKFGFMCELGGIMSPFNAWLLLRGLKTLQLRMERHQQTAQKIVDFLMTQSEVERILYPGLITHPNHEVCCKQMNGFGGIVSFELKGGVKEAKKCVEKMELAKLAVSLGDAETLVEIPAPMTHRAYSNEELQQFGFSNKTIRISTGLEDPADIIADLNRAI